MKKTFTFLFLSFSLCGLHAQTADFYFNVLSPSSIYTSIESFQFSSVADDWGWDGMLDGNVSGELVYAPAGLDGMHTFCDSPTVSLIDKLVLINRGSCEFGLKAFNAQTLGAAAVILVDNTDNAPIVLGSGQLGTEVAIPVIMIKQSAGAPIIAVLENGETVMAELSSSPNPVATVSGTVVADANANCASDMGETPLNNWRVNAVKNGFTNYTYTNAVGEYLLNLDTGAYEISLVPPANGLWDACPGETVALVAYEEYTVDLQASILQECPQLSVDIETPLVRRCFDTNSYFVNYCNEGTATAEGTYVVVALDALTSIVSATFPYNDLGGNTFEFQVGDVGLGECGSFHIGYEVSCDADFGEAVCATAQIFPDTLCAQPLGAWSGESLFITGDCDGTEVSFTLTNDGSGGMSAPVGYQVIRDGEHFEAGQIQLSVGASQMFSFPADGSTYRLEAEGLPGFPQVTAPSATVEGCTMGEEFTVGFVTMFPAANFGASSDEECEEVIGAYDPNDKNASPKGYGDEHFIEPNTDITYVIRFQNTGTDTAFNIKIKDTLSVMLDAASLRPMNSSHYFEFEMGSGNVAEFFFPSIMLPDSNVNEPLSHGFVSFQISQAQDVPLGSVIRNSAAIFFDFNAPVITNEYFHTVGVDFVPTATITVLRPGLELDVVPNPLTESAIFDLHGAVFAEGKMELLDPMGRTVRKVGFDQPRFNFERGDLPAGHYFFKIILDGGHVASGQILVR